MQLIQARPHVQNIRSLLTSFDKDLYQERIDDATRRSYPMDDDQSVWTYLRRGRLRHDRRRVRLSALYTSCLIIVDDVGDHCPEERYNMYLFNDRSIARELQESGVLDTFADVIRRAPDLYHPVASQLTTTPALNFVTAGLLEQETGAMEVVTRPSHPRERVAGNDE